MEFYRGVVSPILDHLPSEPMHKAAREVLHTAELIPFSLTVLDLLTGDKSACFDPRLKYTLGKNVDEEEQSTLPNRMLLAAGWDKPGVSVEAWHVLGAGGAVIGAVLEHPQKGNEGTRQWYWDGKANNRLGFNTPGLKVVARNLERYFLSGKGLNIGVNIGINKDVKAKDAPKAYAAVLRGLGGLIGWGEVNVSSPNTTDLRLLQDPIFLRDIDQALIAVMDEEWGYRIPLLHKVAPDLPEAGTAGVIQVTIDNGFTGMVSANTTTNPDIKSKYNGIKVADWVKVGGGLSGNDPEYRRLVNQQIAFIRRQVRGINNFEIHGVGGVNSFETALEKILAGADLVQLNTAVREIGLSIFAQINSDWVRWMDKQAIWSAEELSQLVGQNSSNY